ncbi:FMN-linked oxidoreductase [Dunaliella salina]|uniref:tRNA-dihydrouridine(16/17) synthase [NAD(P)(+)] n=1 Tax=Dunaliella salina TaxID=3046 RepID=A0ABQ7GDC8_DUNSA|nr:FMN-linked oxidoreductase [Dunaliella salina]|eukprot:KAF5832607.1 FMN-linked oxidoreductase [Dunaliella salina]
MVAKTALPSIPESIGEEQKRRAWALWESIGAPKYHVAPMVDQSELPFRMLCRRNGSTAAYTPMMHARLFAEDPKYRREFTTCEGDRPLFVQFCAHDPQHLVKAGRLVAPHSDYIDINFGCPQRIAKRGNYGAFLMDDLPLVYELVSELVKGVYPTPVSCKIRVFPKLEDTLNYARLIQSAGCSVLAVHGRLREQKDNSATRADWDQIKAVKQALSIPVLANGNIRHIQDAQACLDYTGCDGVLSAESLLVDPALFNPRRLEPEGGYTVLQGCQLVQDYLRLCEQYPAPIRMVKGHVHKMVGPWLAEHVDIREAINTQSAQLTIQDYIRHMDELVERVRSNGRAEPIPAISQKALLRQAAEEARAAAIQEQEREASALANLDAFERLDQVNSVETAAQ